MTIHYSTNQKPNRCGDIATLLLCVFVCNLSPPKRLDRLSTSVPHYLRLGQGKVIGKKYFGSVVHRKLRLTNSVESASSLDNRRAHCRVHTQLFYMRLKLPPHGVSHRTVIVELIYVSFVSSTCEQIYDHL